MRQPAPTASPPAARTDRRDAGAPGLSTYTVLTREAAQPEPEPEDTADDPARRYSISGRVLAPGGVPVAGVKVVARPSSGSRDKRTHETRSGESGDYEFGGLLQGEYNVRTAATANFAATGGLFRAGTQSADLLLRGNQTVLISGRVTDAAGLPLAEVEVKPSSKDGVTVWTDVGGNYRTQFPSMAPGTSLSVLFRLDGYLEERAYVNQNDVGPTGKARLDVQLMSLEGTVKVSGVLRGSDSALLAGELVQLNSPSLNNRYRETSAADGTFLFAAVEPGGDYRLTIHPRSRYESYYQQPIDVQSPSVSLTVTLKPLKTGRLTGRMVDADGSAIPEFSMALKSNRSQSAYVDVTSDRDGYFRVEHTPAGNLMFSTRSRPQLNVSGITLEPGGAADATLVLDWGDNELQGRVRDNSRRPVSGASVQLSGRHVGGGIQSSSLRRTTTDADGNFRFSELGPGMHAISVRMNGFESADRAIDVGRHSGSVDLVLTRLSE
ncbi:MAG: carboxypeptidase-like regulatory domain-containing protein [Woeseiaceae bacterium]